MSRITPPAEKILAVAAIYEALIQELHLNPEPVTMVITKREVSKKDEPLLLRQDGEPEIKWLIDPVVMASLIDASVRIAMSTDTRDMGLLGPDKVAKTDVDPLAVHVDVEGTP